MKKWSLFLVIIWMIGMGTAMPLQGEILLSSYDEMKENGGFEIYIHGVGMGYAWANTYLLHVKGDSPLYCAPPKLVLGSSNYTDILDREIRDYDYSLDTPVELILLRALQRTFPCGKQ